MYRSTAPFASLLLAACLPVVLGGCSVQRPIQEGAYAYNLALEDASNRLLFTNVIRARYHYPMHFSALGQAQASASNSVTPSVSLALPLTEDGARLTPGLSGSRARGGVSVGITAQTSKEFMQGILNPIGLDQLKFLLERGWPAEVVLPLFVSEMTVDGVRYTNEPEGRFAEVSAFIAQVHRMKETLRFAEVPGEVVGPPFPAEPETLARLTMEADGRGLLVEPSPDAPGTYRLRRKAGSLGLSWGDGDGLVEVSARPEPGAPQNALVLRSVQGALYYLGQIVRHQCPGERGPCVGADPFVRVGTATSPPQALLIAARDEPGGAHIAVEVEGVRYYLLKDRSVTYGGTPVTNRSMGTLSLLTQLIRLNQSRADFPGVGVVTVVGN